MKFHLGQNENINSMAVKDLHPINSYNSTLVVIKDLEINVLNLYITLLSKDSNILD